MNDTVNGNIDMKFLMKDSNSAVDFKFNTIVSEQELINFEVTSSSITESKEFEIEAPENFQSIEETDILY